VEAPTKVFHCRTGLGEGGISNGPAKSIPVYVNGREKDTRFFGKLPIIWTFNLFLWITQTLQELAPAFTKFFIFGTQYLDRVRRTTN